MSRHFRALALSVVMILGGEVSAAAADGSANQPQTMVIDLTAPNAQAPAPAAGGGPATMFVDLTKGDAPSAMPADKFGPARVPRTRHVDLSNGAAPPPPDENEDSVQIDTITITGERIPDPNDPLEDSNRGRFRTHVGLHRYFIDPVERTYFFVVPTPAREGIHNFLTNLESPTVLANDLFQGKLDR
ncbi:MAG TPA: MlaA family lipoprotein, partial [Micropepsaceae bacterium]|nr:MlaA family lipoprotein [Micropepsaceae bacterium]